MGVGVRVAWALLVGPLLVGCAELDAVRDYSRSRSLVDGHTGVASIYEPAKDAIVDEHVRAMIADGLTVEEATRVALLNNPGFQSLVAEIGASRADVAQSALLSNPTLSLGLQFPEGGGLTDLTIGFAAQLADLWQIPIRKQIAEAELERTIYTIGQRAVELIAETRARCYRVVALEQSLKFTQQDLALTEHIISLSDAQFRAGEVSEFDVNLARTGALDVREQLITSRGQLDQARAELAEILGLGASVAEIRLVDSLPETAGALPATDTLIETALDERFDLRVAWFAVERAEAALRLEARRFLPDVQLGFAFERSEQRALPGRNILADTARASIASGALTAPSIQSRGERRIAESQIIDAKLGPTLAMTLPLFDQNQAQVAKARIRVLQARKDYESRAQTVIAEIGRAAAAARASAEMLTFQKTTALPQSQATIDGAEQRYRAGEESLLVLIDAQEALVLRRRAFVGALRDHALAIAQLESAVGGATLLSNPKSRE